MTKQYVIVLNRNTITLYAGCWSYCNVLSLIHTNCISVFMINNAPEYGCVWKLSQLTKNIRHLTMEMKNDLDYYYFTVFTDQGFCRENLVNVSTCTINSGDLVARINNTHTKQMPLQDGDNCIQKVNK